ncbi:taurine dioxygenase [Chromatiales bacterium (ex Bugula neritina AB1)]|nr:taurine dioxygenase [Chromatiales bacterium (ex Bugula neritina AB1)]
MTIEVTAAHGAGAYIAGVDLNTLNKTDIDTLRKSLGDYGVLFFRDQAITCENHIRLAEQFGRININRFFTALPDYPQIAQVLKEPDQTQNIGELWHTDHSYDQIPALGSILVARELPQSGGDTLFISMIAAYNGLDASMRKHLQGLTATHSSRHVFGTKALKRHSQDDLGGRFKNADAATQDSIHPVIIRHPISGAQAIYVNPQFTLHINNLPADESNSLLIELYEHCKQEAYQHRFEWKPGSVAFWDNRATWHQALNDYQGERRLMHRITIEGQPLTGRI